MIDVKFYFKKENWRNSIGDILVLLLVFTIPISQAVNAKIMIILLIFSFLVFDWKTDYRAEMIASRKITGLSGSITIAKLFSLTSLLCST